MTKLEKEIFEEIKSENKNDATVKCLICIILAQEAEIATLKNRSADLKAQLLKSAKVMNETSDVILSGK